MNSNRQSLTIGRKAARSTTQRRLIAEAFHRPPPDLPRRDLRSTCRDAATDPVRRLRDLIPTTPLFMGDLILCEILQGFRSEAEARRVERSLRRFETVPLSNPDLARTAAANFRMLRARGITIRKTIDLIIGTFCIERGHALLHDDRDFEPMERFLGLQAV